MAGFYWKQVFHLASGILQTTALSILGVTFQKDCRFTTHLCNKLIKDEKCLFILKGGYTQAELNQLFQSLVIPNLTYGLSVYVADKAELTTVQCFQVPVALKYSLKQVTYESVMGTLTGVAWNALNTLVKFCFT